MIVNPTPKGISKAEVETLISSQVPVRGGSVDKTGKLLHSRGEVTVERLSEGRYELTFPGVAHPAVVFTNKAGGLFDAYAVEEPAEEKLIVEFFNSLEVRKDVAFSFAMVIPTT